MHAFLIQSPNENLSEEKINAIVKSLQSIKLVYPLAKVDDVREITKFTKLHSQNKTTILIYNIDQASIEAQNAFLKTLEEPQDSISFILTATNLEKVVATIQSRTEVINITEQNEIVDETVQFAKDFFELSAGKQLQITSKIRKREDALEFIKKIITGGHSLLQKNTSLAALLEHGQKTHEALGKNGNVQIQLTNFVVKLHA